MANVYEIDYPSDGKIKQPVIEISTGRAQRHLAALAAAAALIAAAACSWATLAPVKRAALAVLALRSARASLSAQRVQRRVFVTARDGSGTPILDLTAGEFELLENGVSREIMRATRVSGPMRIALVVDSSGAVAPLLNNLRAGLTTFLDELPGEHEITFISTGGQIRIRQPITTDRAEAEDGRRPVRLRRRREFAHRNDDGSRSPVPQHGARPMAGLRHRHHGHRAHALGAELRSVQPVRQRFHLARRHGACHRAARQAPAASPPSS